MIKAMTPHSIPVFFCNAGIGINRGVFSPQIRGLDVYYKSPIVVGFHVIGSEEVCKADIQFGVDHYEESAQVVGFYALFTAPPIPEDIQITVEETEDAPKVFGFYAFAPNEVNCSADTVHITDMEAQGPAIDSFQAEGISDD